MTRHKCILNAPPLGTAAFFLSILMPRCVYLDESGDTGWSFGFPLGSGGSTRYLTIGYLIVPTSERHHPKRIVKDFYNKFSFSPNKEVKGKDLSSKHKEYICQKVVDMLNRNPECSLGAITVKKENVAQHIRRDPNKLYNYMIRQSVLHKIDKSPNVDLYRDERTIKVASGKSCIDYLQTTLWFEHGSSTVLNDRPTASHTNLNVMLADWITNMVWSNYEKNTSKHFLTLSPKLHNQTLLF